MAACCSETLVIASELVIKSNEPEAGWLVQRLKLHLDLAF